MKVSISAIWRLAILRRRAIIGGRLLLADAAEERDFAGFDVGDEEAVGSLPVHGVPQAVAEFELLAVLGEFGVLGDGRFGGIVRDDRVEIAVDEGFEAGAVAGAGLGLRGEGGREQDCGGEGCESHDELRFVREKRFYQSGLSRRGSAAFERKAGDKIACPT